jgi:SpoIID/LytB domain protein
MVAIKRIPLRFVACLCALAVLAPVVSSQSAEPARADTLPPLGVIVRGHGNGHGRGMSQYGALGWATKLAATWQDILNFYYGGNGRTLSALTDAEIAPTSLGIMTVRLRTLDAKPTSVISDNGTASWSGTTGTFGGLVARMVSKNVFDVYGSATATCAVGATNPSGFTLIGRNVAGPIDFVTANGSLPTAVLPTDLLGLCEPSTTTYKNGRIRYYRGGIRATSDSNGNRRTINLVPTELYLRGVVPRESPAGWGDIALGAGMNALRAQAVAARSYSLSEKRYSYAKTCDTQDCQVYGGSALRTNGSASVSIIEDKRTDNAISETANMVMRNSNNSIVRTEFTSSNGGRTASGQFVAQVDNGDLIADPVLQSWSKLISAGEIQTKYPTIGVFTSITTTHDGLGGDWNGYTTSVVISGTAGSVTRTGWDFRGDFSLNAPWYETFPIAGADPAAPAVGSILFIGDSVGESIKSKVASFITPAYPTLNFQACAGRGMAGADCLFTVAAPQVDLDGVGIINALETPAIAIVELGYNDDPNTFAAELQQALAALASKAVQRVVFVTMSTRTTSRNYAIANAALLNAASTNPSISIFDWNAASSAPNQWRWFDNTSVCCWVHLSTTGQAEFSLFLREQLDILRTQGLLPINAPVAAVIPGLPLVKSNTGVMVASLQKRLNTVLHLKGKNRLKPDGIYGAATIKRVKAFQKKVALPRSGKVDRGTWEALGLAARPELSVLMKGTRHPAVLSVQRALSKVLKKKIPNTLVFSSNLTREVKVFQRRMKIRATGKVDVATWSTLMATSSLA